MYNYIRDPISKRKISIKSDSGINTYSNLFRGASSSYSNMSNGRTMNHSKISDIDKINVGTPREIESLEAEWNPSHVDETLKIKLNTKNTKNIITN